MHRNLIVPVIAMAVFLLPGIAMVQAADNTGTGGTITYTDASGSNAVASPPYPLGYVVHTFTSSGTYSNSHDVSADVLVVAGGGQGGCTIGGGGGAGGLIYSNSFSAVADSNYTVTVGDGGESGASWVQGESGDDSSFGTNLVANGGGGGGGWNSSAGLTGGSGGGSCHNNGSSAAGTAGQGNAGGSSSGDGSGGGGGAGSAGGNGSNPNCGAGGAGLAYDLSGGTVWYAGGGGGGAGNSGTVFGAGGIGGGGDGSAKSSSVPGEDGVDGTGGGGGGGSYSAATYGGKGGSGIVIIRYPYDSGNLSAWVTSPAADQQFLPGSSVTATVAVTSGEAPYDVTFYTNSAVAWSTNNSSTNLFIIDLGALANGAYTNYASVTDNLSSNDASPTNTFTVAPDATPPDPDPMTFALPLNSLNSTTIVVTASTATDTLSPPVEYYFLNASNSDNSGWISSTVWTNTGLTEGTTYGYQVKARDSVPNETAYSAISNAIPIPPIVTWDGSGDMIWTEPDYNSFDNQYNDGKTALFFDAGAGTVTLSGSVKPGGIVVSNNATTYTFNGDSIDGTGTLTKAGSARLNIIGNNNFTGGLVINAGSIGENTALSTAALNNNDITVNGDATIVFAGGATTSGGITLNNESVLTTGNNNSSITVNGAVTGSGGLKIKKIGDGANTIYLNSVANTFTGGVNFASGRRIRLYLNSFVDSGTPGAGNILFSVARSAYDHEFILASGFSTALTLNNRQFDLGSPSEDNFAVIRNHSSQEFTINSDLIVSGTGAKPFMLGGTGTGTNTFAGSITNGAGVVALTKAESGTWVLSGSNTYSGGTTVSAGALIANGTNALGAGDVTVSAGELVIDTNVTASSATLALPSASSVNLTLNADLTVGSLSVAGLSKPVGVYTSAEAWIDGSGALYVGDAAIQPLWWDSNGATAGAGGATPTGTWGTDNYWSASADGDAVPGAWVPGRTAAFAAGTDASGDYTVSVNGTLDIAGITFEEGNVVVSGGTALQITQDGGVFYVASASQTGTVATAISEDAPARSMVKDGEGVLVLSGANSFTGPTTVNAGTLVLSNDNAIATEDVNLEGGNMEVGANVSISNLTFSGTNGTVSGSGNLNFGAGAVIDSKRIYATNSGNPGGVVHTISCGISGTPDVYIGGTQWPATQVAMKRVRFEPTGTNNQTLGNIEFHALLNGPYAGVTLAGSSTNNTVESFSSTQFSYEDHITKEGSGKWTVNGNAVGPSAYSWYMHVLGGTLIWNGEVDKAGPLDISNARFGGNFLYDARADFIGDVIVKSGGILSPGDGGTGTMTFDWGNSNTDRKLQMQDNSTYEFDVGATTNDLIHMGGDANATVETLDLDNFVLRILDAGGKPEASNPLPIFTYDTHVTVDMSGFGDTAANYDLVTAGLESWGRVGLSLSNDAAGTIYLVGLEKPPAGSVFMFK